MAGAVIGALRVDLGLNSAQFDKGLKGASGSMAAFAANAAKIGAVVGTALAAAAAGFGVAMKSAIDNADDIGKSAQKIGLPAEELSKLKYAASLADVDMNTLSTSMIRLSKNMADIASGGTGPAAQAFTALGISVKNTDGTMKSSSVVLSEIATKFSDYADGVNKTALAVAIFGKAGAEMIPLLNQGAEAIEKAKQEAVIFGQEISGKFAASSESVNDNMTRLAAVFSGFANIIASELAPHLEAITNALIEWIKNAGGAQSITEAVGDAMRSLATFVATTVGEFQALIVVGQGVYEVLKAIDAFDFSKSIEGVSAALDKAKTSLAEIKQNTQNSIDLINIPSLTIGGGGKKPPKPEAPGLSKGDSSSAKQAANDIENAYDQINAAGKRVFEQTRTPAEKLTNELGRLQDMLSVGAINWDTYGRAVAAAHEKYDKAIVTSKDVSRTLESGLGGMWDDFIDGTLNAAESIKKLGQSMLKMLGNKLIGSMLDGLFGGKGGGAAGGGGILGSILGAFGLKGFASGGDFTGGKPILVGERGPEIITPRMAGNVIPNHELGGGGGGVNIQIVNESGAQVAQPEVSTGSDGKMMIRMMIRDEFNGDIAKNGPIAQMLQGRYGMNRSGGRR